MSGHSLVDWLRAQDELALVELLRARPDLATPPPPDTGVLATRAGMRASVVRACEDLDAFTRSVLDALVIAGAELDPQPLARINRLMGRGVPAARTKEAVRALRELAVAWGPDTAISVVPAATEITSQFPGNLGRPAPQLDELDLPGLLDELDPAERRLLETLAAGPPIGRTKDAGRVVPLERAESPVQSLMARGLLLRRDNETVELPRQLGLLLRGDRPMGQVQVTQPELTVSARGVSTVDSTAAGAALELLRHMEGLIALWSVEPPGVLRSGGLGVRDLRRLAKELEVEESRAILLAELALDAAIIDNSGGGEPEWVPTTHADSYLAAAPDQQWATLAVSWLELSRLPALAGRRDERDKLLNPLSNELRRPSAVRERHRVLGVLAELPQGSCVGDVEQLVAALAWRAPARGGRMRDDLVRWIVEEATALGVVALGGLSTAGAALLNEGPGEAAKRMLDSLPEPIDHVLVQADLTVVAPGRLEPELAADIALAADVESAGGATVYRITDRTVRRALDAGRSAAELHELFAKRSRTPIPQSLSYLIDDIARKHGQLRGGPAGSFLRCDDPALIAEVLANADIARLELRRIAPTVLISPLALIDVLDGLRESGYAPAAEGPDGAVVDLRPAGHRIPGRPQGSKRLFSPARPSVEQLASVVRQIRAGDRAADVPRGAAVSTSVLGTAATMALLQEAADSGRSVWIGVVDSHGTASQQIVTPVSVAGGVLEAFDAVVGMVCRFPLHRITSTAVVED
ncbi:helicase-associated domain-containing protein [Allokutzneria sp. A3M-2-11 16]|uniref:helicase-associated domain-containing protein n=1 Tax=Allokutzneria sp. A3M-2-11 16 TaxID=2962043 RepID=UPI0020B7D53C|nr:helicase-associated domain-containing protein [Allokutzneria sp. A3M-2-11 16]MCP3800086.1 helicase-associated domain-containing protein [Allokutzneria sp. A3M-2-11 16]